MPINNFKSFSQGFLFTPHEGSALASMRMNVAVETYGEADNAAKLHRDFVRYVKAFPGAAVVSETEIERSPETK